MSLNWKRKYRTVHAISACCVDEDHLTYVFTSCDGVWQNESDIELRLPNSPKYFDDLKDAIKWAEEMETGWLDALALPVEVDQ